ncbi:NAD(P)H-dependent oxidoreductase [Facklamia sp. DSM 111018]|uniref:NAD(P)H-dependent oxidoreductase n=1 Tax=Facklamia lactis TaxID=2749967 RepID=A0ABS0LPF2_9LACT|nr:NADPH-dependent FMN reductase [Facklamia lactis]MBG9980225.1 NAD(P)H-dependent oxidoreductase [Facklamia lactis]MBG9986028.1 NAD(P)H-dependent oxidoreductase [Facklamia lactis]
MTKLGIIVGSTRANSFSKQWADNIAPLYPEGTEIEYLDIANLPLYNQDLDANSPQEYTEFRQDVERQDAILFVTPEHNRSISAALKNALDVASRPWGESVWGGKPTLIASHSISGISGFGANHHLRQILTFLGMPMVTQPEVYLANSQELLDENGKAPQDTLDFLQTAVDAHISMVK